MVCPSRVISASVSLPESAAKTVLTYGRLDLFDMCIGCEWLQVNKVRAQAQDPATFDEMYVLVFLCSWCSYILMEKN